MISDDNSPVRILMIEDNPGDARLMMEVFKEGKIHAVMAVVCDGIEAMSYLKKEGKYANESLPDLIFLDLNLPKKNGFEVLEEIRKDEKIKHIPVVILTTSTAEQDMLKGYHLRANYYLTKPVELEKFMEAMRAMGSFLFSRFIS